MVKARDCDETGIGSAARPDPPRHAGRALLASAAVVASFLATIWLAARLGAPGSSAPRASWIYVGAAAGATASVLAASASRPTGSIHLRRLGVVGVVLGASASVIPVSIEAWQLARDFAPPEGTSGAAALGVAGSWVLLACVAPLAWLCVPASTCDRPPWLRDAVALLGIGLGLGGVAWLVFAPRFLGNSNEPQRLEVAAIDRARALAEDHLSAARGRNGQLRYAVDAGGSAQFDRYSLARHAGPTLALCDHARSEAGLHTAREAIRFLLGHERRDHYERVGHLTRTLEAERFALTDQALPLVTLARCRRRLGPWPALDRALARLARGLLEHVRDDGSLAAFSPEFAERPRRAAFVDGQALLALIELRDLAVTDPALDLDASTLTEALRSTLAWTARADARTGPAALVTLEANWRCAAATRLLSPEMAHLRKQLPSHDLRALEDLCLRYVAQRRFASRYGIGLGPTSGDQMQVGPTAVLAESIAAAIEIQSVRGRTSAITPLRRDLERLVAAIVTTQWLDGPARGGFPESPRDPYTRIDTAQHAFDALAALARLRAT